MLITTGVSWAVIVDPAVNHPQQNAPEWWNFPCDYYAYGWWEADILTSPPISPPDDEAHWASNFLTNTDFTASMVGTEVTIDLLNEFREDFYKEIFILVTGTTTSTQEDFSSNLDTGGGVFEGWISTSISGGAWSCLVEGEITPQPAYVTLTVTVPGLTGVTNIWAGENCLPEPATIALLGLGALSLIRVRRKTRA